MGVGTRFEEISDKQSRSSWSVQGKEYKAPSSPSSLTGSAPPKLSCRLKTVSPTSALESKTISLLGTWQRKESLQFG